MNNELQAKSSLRVCIVSPLFHPNLGGVGRQAIALSEYLHSAGVEVVVMCRKFVGLLPWKQRDGLQVIQVPSLGSRKFDLEAKSAVNLLISLSYCFSLMFALIRFRVRYDIVHFHGSSLHLIVNVIPLKIMGKKVIAKVAGAKMDVEAGSFKSKYLFLGDIFVRMLKRVDLFIAITDEIRQDLLDEGYAPEKIFKTSNFILSEQFYPLEDSIKKKALKKTIGVPEDKYMITFSGRLVQRKRLDVLLEAISLLRRSRQNFVVYILGTGELMEGLVKKSDNLHLQDSVVFRGNVSNMLDYLQASDLYVITSDREGMPNSLLEAMACRLPVIATRIGGVVDVIEDKKNGLLVTSGDVEELKDAILKLLGDERLSKSISQEAYRTIKENYYIDKVADKYISLYKRVLNEL